MTTSDQILHLIPEDTLDIEAVCVHLDNLIADQNCRIQHGQPLSPTPLLWLALALAAGLDVSVENAVVAGAHSALSAARNAGLVIDQYAANGTNAIGRIREGPHAPPQIYSIQAESIRRSALAQCAYTT